MILRALFSPRPIPLRTHAVRVDVLGLRRDVAIRTSSSGSGSQGTDSETRRRWLGLISFGVMVGTTVALGSWQLSRYQWKKQLLQTRSEQLSGPLLSLDAALAAAVAGDVDMRRVTVDGRFDFEREIRVAPRSPPKGTPEGLTPPNGNNGFLVFTPLITRDGSRILVQRGWWPAGTDVTHSASSTGASVTGVIRLVGEQPSSMWAVGHYPDRNTYSWIDLPAIAAHCDVGGGLPQQTQVLPTGGAATLHDQTRALTPGAAPRDDKNNSIGTGSGGDNLTSTASSTPPLFYIEAVDALPKRKGIFPLTRQMESMAEAHVMPDTHLIYAATWYTLAACGAAIMFARFRRGTPRGARLR